MTPWPLPRWIAHRGAGKLAPENTLAAFRIGASHGYRAFECDVKLSHDGVPFLLHDDTLERTSTGQGIAGDRTWAELSRLDAGSWHSRAFAGEPVPSLQAIAAFVQSRHIARCAGQGAVYPTRLVVGHAVARLDGCRAGFALRRRGDQSQADGRSLVDPIAHGPDARPVLHS
jgi:hypothetical protein